MTCEHPGEFTCTQAYCDCGKRPNIQASTSNSELVMRIIEAAHVNLEHQLFSEYEGYEIELEREDEDDQWYIQVRPIEQGHLYDGWWRGSEGESKEAAVREALRGAQILGA